MARPGDLDRALIEKDISAFLARQRDKQLLRFITCGSVDDGKSTLIGRLLYDSKMLYEDQLAQLESESQEFRIPAGGTCLDGQGVRRVSLGGRISPGGTGR